MATPPAILLTPRDVDILAALERCPLTAGQLLSLSRAFALPFTDERRVRERLQELCAAGRVRQWFYATAGRGALGYYTLTRLGYRLLHGDDAGQLPKRAFGPIGFAHQFHAMRLADFIVHTVVAAHRAGLAFSGFYRENSFRLSVGTDCLYPDCAFQLLTATRFAFSFFVELDNSTEAIRSDRDRDTWERKIRLYDAFQDLVPKRFRVLIFTTRSAARARHILDTARAVVRNPQRSLFYAVSLNEYLSFAEALSAPCFRDPQGRRRALVWRPQPAPPARRLDHPCQEPLDLCYPVPPAAVAVAPA